MTRKRLIVIAAPFIVAAWFAAIGLLFAFAHQIQPDWLGFAVLFAGFGFIVTAGAALVVWLAEVGRF